MYGSGFPKSEYCKIGFHSTVFVENFVLRLDFIELLLLITPKQNNYLFLSKKYVILNAFFFFGSFCMGGGGIKNMEN